ncbi:PepSY domain-containing protein [Bacillus dakarensis]|uniref:PepSY domain-containing protein n=1 Tax=Robertmurraya dakarensis TaxID=1926278 RepID=UPI000A05E4D8|nr:PepSY domain-containing protein [Bacillus dakarensis]
MMGRKNWLFMIGAGVLLIAILIGVQKWQEGSVAAEALTKEEAQRMVEEKYSGKVLNITMEDQQFNVDLERGDVIYKVLIDGNSGEVLSLEKLQNKETVDKETADSKKTDSPSKEQIEETPPKPNEKEPVQQNPGDQGKVTESIKTEEPPKKLSENEAVQIALTQIQGEIDDVEIRNINGAAYYFVEVESGDDREGLVQIHAITGEVKSITWDEED